MIYDVDCIAWWKFVIPLTSCGKLDKRYYKHRAYGWYVVRDGFRKPHVYWEDRVRQVRRITPPPLEREVGIQTDNNTRDTPVRNPAIVTKNAEVQTKNENDMWDALRESVAGLPAEMEEIVCDRLVRFLDMGLLHPRIPQIHPDTEPLSR